MNQKTPPRGLRIHSINYCLIAAAAILYIFLLYATVQISLQYNELVEATEDYIACQRSANQIQAGSDNLTEQVRMFAVTRDVTYASAYFTEANVTRTREKALEYLKTHHSDEVSYAYLQSALECSNALIKKEMYSMKLAATAANIPEDELPEDIWRVALSPEDLLLSPGEQLEKAKNMVLGEDYKADKDCIDTNVFLALQNVLVYTRGNMSLSQSELHSTIKQQRIYVTVLFVMNLLTFVMIAVLVVRPLRIYIRCIRDDKALELIGAYEFKYLALTYNNIYEINAANNIMLRRKAEIDPLTGVMNRGAFERLKDSLRTKKMPLALILLDVDKFKQVNDSYGHEIGDKVLQKVASLLKSSFRPTDFVIRMGGDEFTVVLPDTTPEIRPILLNKINSINQTLSLGADGLPPASISVGVAFTDSGFPDELYRNADTALYEVKRRGRAGCNFYEG